MFINTPLCIKIVHLLKLIVVRHSLYHVDIILLQTFKKCQQNIKYG